MQYSLRDLAEQRITLSAEYGRSSEELEEVLAKKPEYWIILRDNTKSDTAADRQWEGTPEGIKEMRLRMKMKRVEKTLSSVKSLLDVLIIEAKNVV